MNQNPSESIEDQWILIVFVSVPIIFINVTWVVVLFHGFVQSFLHQSSHTNGAKNRENAGSFLAASSSKSGAGSKSTWHVAIRGYPKMDG